MSLEFLIQVQLLGRCPFKLMLSFLMFPLLPSSLTSSALTLSFKYPASSSTLNAFLPASFASGELSGCAKPLSPCSAAAYAAALAFLVLLAFISFGIPLNTRRWQTSERPSSREVSDPLFPQREKFSFS